jgi:anthranilate synthase component 2
MHGIFPMQIYKKMGKGTRWNVYLCAVRILLVDNYDSFTWNLHHYLDQFAEEVVVCRNDNQRCLELDDYDGVVISPGPGLPHEAALTMQVIARADGKVPLFGVCLGLQAIVEFFGGSLFNLPQVLHGRQCTTLLNDPDPDLFREVPESIQTGHYHSWVANPETLPDVFSVTAVTTEGLIMAINHKTLPIKAVQFHPESVLTPDGLQMIGNVVQWMQKGIQ